MHLKNLPDLLSRTSAILFDFNGTLSNDESLLEASYDEALSALGYPALGTDEYSSLLGLSEPDIARALIEARASDNIAERSAELIETFARHYQEACRIQPRVSDESVAMVRRLANTHRLGIVTGTLRQLVVPILQDRGIFDCFSTVVAIEDVENGKPDPAGFLLGAKNLGVEPNSIIVLEDSRAGVAAAQAAGMHVIGVGTSTGLVEHLEKIEDFAPAGE